MFERVRLGSWKVVITLGVWIGLCLASYAVAEPAWGEATDGETLAAPTEAIALGLTYISQQDYNRALVHFEKITTENSTDANAWFYRGVCLGRLGRYQEGIEVVHGIWSSNRRDTGSTRLLNNH